MPLKGFHSSGDDGPTSAKGPRAAEQGAATGIESEVPRTQQAAKIRNPRNTN